jgi:hypothetical protein
MTGQSMEWQEPLTPWQIVRRRFFNGQGPDITVFSQKHGLSEVEVQRVFSGIDTAFSPELCAVFSRDTGMSEQFFANLSDQHQRMAA